MKKKILLVITCFTVGPGAFAQSLSPTVIAPAGSSENGKNLTLNWTLGEPAIQTLETSNELLTEGFHQPLLIIKEVLEASQLLLSGQINVSVGPNPTASILHIKIDSELDATGFMLRMLWNLPLVVPAAWGAWWFNRQALTYDRLAEEYRQKEAISKAFVG